jgi:hypothetical protein
MDIESTHTDGANIGSLPEAVPQHYVRVPLRQQNNSTLIIKIGNILNFLGLIQLRAGATKG